MTTKLAHTDEIKSVQVSFTDKKIAQKLEGYKKVQNKDICKLKPGDSIRYSVKNEFRGGGKIKLMRFPDYLVCMNVIKNVSWSVQLKDPTLIIWVRTIEDEAKKMDEMKKIYELYKAKKLVKKT